ncbi:MAG: hypothetical protein WKG07_45775 [Hymenobacter sp.]
MAVVNSVQAYWEKREPNYQRATTVFFTGNNEYRPRVGHLQSARSTAPRTSVYIDLGFYEDLRTCFGAMGGPFAEACDPGPRVRPSRRGLRAATSAPGRWGRGAGRPEPRSRAEPQADRHGGGVGEQGRSRHGVHRRR